MKHKILSSALSVLLTSALLLCGCDSSDSDGTSGSGNLTLLGGNSSSVSSSSDHSPATVPENTRPEQQTSDTNSATPTQPQTSQSPIPIIDFPMTVSPEIDQTAFKKVSATAKYVLVFDETDDQLLYLRGDPEEVIYPASITKLLTVLYGLTVLDDTDEIFTIGEEITWIGPHSSVVNLKQKEQYTAKDLIACMLLRSGNDAAYSFATGCGLVMAGEEEVTRREALNLFLNGMNEYGATVLKLENTHFESPDGFHSDGHYTTLRDLLQICRTAYVNPIIREMTQLTHYTTATVDGSRTLEVESTNQLLYEDSPYYFPYANGLKTGSTDMAGACVAASANKDGHEVIILLMKSGDNKIRFQETLAYLKAAYQTLESAAS